VTPFQTQRLGQEKQIQQQKQMHQALLTGTYEACWHDFNTFNKCLEKTGTHTLCEKEYKANTKCLTETLRKNLSMMTTDGQMIEDFISNMFKFEVPLVQLDKELKQTTGNFPMKCLSLKKKIEMCNKLSLYANNTLGKDCKSSYQEIISCVSEDHEKPQVDEFKKCWKKEIHYRMNPEDFYKAYLTCKKPIENILERYN
jgi:hypothetical protein